MLPVSSELRLRMTQRSHRVNGLAFTYIVMGYALSLIGITSQSWVINLFGVLLLVHTLLWAAYFVHELIHGTIFRNPRLNAGVGNILLFLTGSCYCRFRDLAQNHLAHHKNRADFSAFSMADFLRSLPKPLRQSIVALEWMYFPIINFILRGFCIVAPFLGNSRRDERWRTVGLLLVRGGFFVGLGWYAGRSLLLYSIAYICFINLLRFMDCFQHTYAVFQLGQPLPQYSLEYEEANTYSNILLGRWRWLNLLFLNFGYHNAHHRIPYCPWYLLPQLDTQLYPQGYRQHITLDRFVKNYHQFRIDRLFHDGGMVTDTAHGLKLDQFVGAVGVSFLLLRQPLEWLEINVPVQAESN